MRANIDKHAQMLKTEPKSRIESQLKMIDTTKSSSEASKSTSMGELISMYSRAAETSSKKQDVMYDLRCYI